MVLQDIISKIRSEAKLEVERIKKEGKKKVKEIKEENAKKVKAEKERLINQAKQEAENMISQARYKAYAQAKSLILRKKQEIIDQVYNQALDYLAKLDDNAYVNLITHFIKQLPDIRDLPAGKSGIIIPVKGKEDLTKKALVQSGRKYALASKSIEGIGGFIFQSAKFEIDNTFTTLIKLIRDKTEIEVSKILFGKS